MSPSGWNYSIETIGVANSSTGWEGVASWQTSGDPFFAGAGSPFTTVTEVLHWYSNCWVDARESARIASSAAIVSCECSLQDAIMPGGSLSGFSFLQILMRLPHPTRRRGHSNRFALAIPPSHWAEFRIRPE